MRTFDYVDSFKITGRGMVYSGVMPDPALETGEEVIIDGEKHVILGIEAFSIERGRDPGMPVGVLIKP